jgi:NAD(P)-dependent dehydrogenase (short-subunit alcohol dehydrogenase family)
MTQDRKLAVVCGGSAGVGRAVTDALIARGYTVAVLARGASRLEALKAHHGPNVWTRVADVTDQGQIDRAADALVAEHGAPSVWVNSAMLTSFSRFEDVPDAEFRKITDTTYFGTVNGCRTALRIMDRGSIVNVGSGLAYTSVPYQAAYCAAKHAIEGFTQALRIELARDERPIALSQVQLPAINTPQFDWARNRMDEQPQPAPPIFQPEVAARAVLKAIDERSREVLVGRSVLQLVAGNFLLPDLVETQLEKMGVEAQKSGRPARANPDNLDGPVEDYPTRAHGPYDDRAEASGVIVDGDRARKTALFGGALALLAIGWGLGRAMGGSRTSEPEEVAVDRSLPAPRYVRPTEYRH